MSEAKKDHNEIPIVKLGDFSFSPPGPMGWSSAEYESMLADPELFLSQYKIKHPEPQNENIMLVELPVRNRRNSAVNQTAFSPVKKEAVSKEMIAPSAVPVKTDVFEPAIMEAVQDDQSTFNYDQLMEQLIDEDSDFYSIQDDGIFIGIGKRKSKTYSSRRTTRVIFI
ncbi:hypothetical protein RFW18_01975 [Metabacillus idriensis]|uniref:hypothetical protein n=1 Tax=Metabacillus idriensis TaxID=324768 RepID=UPI0028141B3D|nr:hypothetical protein [Metabacillus idriensis]MDR0136499.1 hypothetical protein [Metabacillus idriensis]